MKKILLLTILSVNICLPCLNPTALESVTLGLIHLGYSENKAKKIAQIALNRHHLLCFADHPVRDLPDQQKHLLESAKKTALKLGRCNARGANFK